MPGAGSSPAGSTPAGYGSVLGAPAPNFTALPDAASGLSQSGRLLNQKTGDYVFTADGRLTGMGTAAQLVLLAIEGIDFSPLMAGPKVEPSFTSALTALVQNALAPLTTQGLILVQRITVLSAGKGGNADAGIGEVDWQDLSSGQNSKTQTTPFGG